MTQTKGQLLGEATSTGNITLNTQKELRFADSDSSHYVALQAPATVASNVTYTLPAADGSANQILKTNGSGVLSWGEDPAGQWVTNGNNLEYSAGNVDINSDSNKLRLGASNDLELYHNGSNSRIVNTHASQFSIGSDITALTNAAVSEDLAKFIANGAVELYYDNSKKIQTASHGIDILDDVVFDNGTNAGKDINWIEASNTMRWQDTVKATFGFSDDLTIHHDGANSYITESGTGELYIQGNTFVSIRDSVDGDTMAKFIKDGAVELYHNASKKVNTTAAGVQMPSGTYFQFDAASSHAWAIGATTGSDLPAGSGIALQFHYWNNSAWDKISYQSADGIGVPDSKKFIAGDSSDLNIYHDGSNSFFDNLGTGSVVHRVQNGDIHFQYYDGSSAEDMAVLKKNGAVELYYDNSKKLHTFTGGVKFFGTLEADDSDKIKLGDNADLELFHDGSNSYLKKISAGNGNLYIDSDGSSDLYLRAGDGSTGNDISIRCYSGAGVDLRYAGAKQCETNSGGMNWADSKRAYFGNSSDLQIYHDGSNSFISNTHASSFYIQSNGNLLLEHTNGENYVKGNANGSVELYYDNSKKVETTSSGVTVTGNVNLAADNNSFTVGAGQDLQIYHDGTNNILRNVGTRLDVIVNSSETAAVFNPNTSVDLYYDNVKTFETISEGVRVQGNEGASAVLELWADQGDDNGDKWRLVSDQSSNFFYLQNYASGGWESTIRALGNGNVELYYDDVKKFETNAGGVDVTGVMQCDGITLLDNEQFQCGTNVDLRIYHDSSDNNTYIKESGSGNLYIYSANLRIENADGSESYIEANDGGAVELYYDGVKRFHTLNHGAYVTGDFEVFADTANNYVSQFKNDGANTNRYGINIQCGADDAAGTNTAVRFADGNGDQQGLITFSGGTVTYGAFTAHHPCIVPDSENPSDSSNAYPYGTLLETISIEYTQKNGADTERGIRYKVQKTQSANSRKVLGAYGSSMNGGPDNQTNEHQALVLGDGHILVNNAGGNIEVGDGICSSATAGIGQKATANPSMVIGIAQEAITFTGSETKLVAVQYGLQQFTPWT